MNKRGSNDLMYHDFIGALQLQQNWSDLTLDPKQRRWASNYHVATSFVKLASQYAGVTTIYYHKGSPPALDISFSGLAYGTVW